MVVCPNSGSCPDTERFPPSTIEGRGQCSGVVTDGGTQLEVGWCINGGRGGQGQRLVAASLYTRFEASLTLSRGPGPKPGASLYTRKCLSLSHGRPGESLVPRFTRRSAPTLSRAQGESLVPHFTRRSAPTLTGPGRKPGAKPGASFYTQKRLFLLRGPGRKHGASLYTRKRLSPLSLGWCKLKPVLNASGFSS